MEESKAKLSLAREQRARKRDLERQENDRKEEDIGEVRKRGLFIQVKKRVQGFLKFS